METSQKIDTSIINIKVFFMFMLTLTATGSILAIIIAIKLHMISIIVIGIFVFFICPTLLFQKKLRNIFTKKATITFSDDFFTVELFNPKTGKLEKQDINNFIDIKSFMAINSVKDDSSFLKVKLKNKKKFTYTFLDQINDNGKNDITTLVTHYVQLYNARQSETNKIILSPNLFASRTGTYIILGLGVLLVVTILLQAIYKPKTIPFTLFVGIFLYIQIINQRKRDVKDVEDFKDQM